MYFAGSLGFSKANPTQSQLKVLSAPVATKSEVISILKRRSSDQNVLVAPHEDASDAYSEASSQSFSDESLSRNRHLKYDSEEDSDFDDYGVSLLRIEPENFLV